MGRRSFKELKQLITRQMTAESTDTGTATVITLEYGPRGNVKRGKVVGVKLATYLTVPAVTWEVRERGAAGKRTIYVMWLERSVGQTVVHDAGTVEARTVTGDARRRTLEVIHDYEVVKIEGVSLFTQVKLPND